MYRKKTHAIAWGEANSLSLFYSENRLRSGKQ